MFTQTQCTMTPAWMQQIPKQRYRFCSKQWQAFKHQTLAAQCINDNHYLAQQTNAGSLIFQTMSLFIQQFSMLHNIYGMPSVLSHVTLHQEQKVLLKIVRIFDSSNPSFAVVTMWSKLLQKVHGSTINTGFSFSSISNV
jgi:hypothetical protein